MRLLRLARAHSDRRPQAGGERGPAAGPGGCILELTLVRHAATALNDARQYQGWIDPPLSERGRSEALRVGARLGGSSFDLILSSDLRRCRETLELALPDRPVEVDRRLRELDFGSWDGRTYEECLASDELGLRIWIEDPLAASPPEGEPFELFRARVNAVLDALPARGRVLILTHGGPIRLMLARVLTLEWRHVVLMQLSTAAITRLAVHTGGGHLLCLNDTAHLENPTFPEEGTAS
ncbi:MAG: histidine phosphatase family protein [Gemmatimonadetes bacterium]|nr:histidine phosphatase family protein [Gemmatimonadota bacterium]